MWYVIATLVSVWFLLTVILQKGGYVHIILIAALSCLVIQLMAIHKQRSHRESADQ